MKLLQILKFLGLSAAGLAAFTVPSAAQGPTPALLDGLKKGQWVVRERGVDGASRRVCIGDPGLLLQVEHGRASCSRYVIEDEPGNARVSYKCGTQGHGVTSIRRESSDLVQIESQGIRNNAPFAFSAEGRYVGACT